MIVKKKYADRFWSKVEKTEGCWIWTAGQRQGYGAFHMNRRIHYAHRVAYQLLVGEIPDGLTVDHLCRNTRCVNPAHMEIVTMPENSRRNTKFQCKNGHEFTNENTYIRPDRGTKECRECRRQALRKLRVKRMEERGCI